MRDKCSRCQKIVGRGFREKVAFPHGYIFFPASTKLAHHCAEWSRVPVEAGCLNSGMRVQGCGIIQIIIRAPASRKLLTPAVYDTVSWVVQSRYFMTENTGSRAGR